MYDRIRYLLLSQGLPKFMMRFYMTMLNFGLLIFLGNIKCINYKRFIRLYSWNSRKSDSVTLTIKYKHYVLNFLRYTMY